VFFFIKIAISYGYNNIIKTIPQTLTVGKPLKLNHLSDLLRNEISRNGFVEILTHGLCSLEDNYDNCLREGKDETNCHVTLSNPCNKEYQMVRTSLLPGTLKTLEYNKYLSFHDGIKIFEISDVVKMVEGHEVGAMNERNIICCYSGPSRAFEVIHGTIDKIMRALAIPPIPSYALNSMTKGQYQQLLHASKETICYGIYPSNDPTFFNGRCGEVQIFYSNAIIPAEEKEVEDEENNENTKKAEEEEEGGGTEDKKKKGKDEKPFMVEESLEEETNRLGEGTSIGTFGLLHPTILKNFDIMYPTSVVEIKLEPLI